jgi:hypothetical protein
LREIDVEDKYNLLKTSLASNENLDNMSLKSEESTMMVTENYKIVTMEHEMRVDGSYLCEKKQQTLISPVDSNSKPTIIMIHIRTFDEKTHKVTETQEGDKEIVTVIETEMTEDEIQQFNEDWMRLWTPKINQQQIC